MVEKEATNKDGREAAIKQSNGMLRFVLKVDDIKNNPDFAAKY
jgi:hypothetical protein